MKAFVWALLALASVGCSRDRTADGGASQTEPQREAESGSATQDMRERSALNVYAADARAACASEINRKLKSPTTMVPESAFVKWDPGYLTGDRARTKQQFPASESFIVRMVVEHGEGTRKSRTEFTCQAVCLNKGYCNSVSTKP